MIRDLNQTSSITSLKISLSPSTKSPFQCKLYCQKKTGRKCKVWDEWGFCRGNDQGWRCWGRDPKSLDHDECCRLRECSQCSDVVMSSSSCTWKEAKNSITFDYYVWIFQSNSTTTLSAYQTISSWILLSRPRPSLE